MKEINIRVGIITVFLLLMIGVLVAVLLGDKEEVTEDNETIPTFAEVVSVTETSTEIATTYVEITETSPIFTETELETQPAEIPTEPEIVNGTTAPATSRYIVTSRPSYAFDSRSCYIDIGNIQQNPELPTGCEVTALTILLTHWGYDADKVDMARNYLFKSSGNAQYKDGLVYKDSFFDFFIGDPFGRGYGCFSPAIVKTANKYIAENGDNHKVVNLSGCSFETLYNYLAEGIPVLVWATDGMIPPEYYETWYDNATGERLDWYLNEHCFVLVGFNLDNNTVTFNDPIKGIIDYSMTKFEQRFVEMHSQAVVILPKNVDVDSTIDEVEETSVVEADNYSDGE